MNEWLAKFHQIEIQKPPFIYFFDFLEINIGCLCALFLVDNHLSMCFLLLPGAFSCLLNRMAVTNRSVEFFEIGDWIQWI